MQQPKGLHIQSIQSPQVQGPEYVLKVHFKKHPIRTKFGLAYCKLRWLSF